MRIECDHCAASYSIADAKLRSPSFEIRCKQCREFIVVRRSGQEMTAQRSEDSVLFSLDKLAPPAVARAAGGMRPVMATRVPVSGGSGLIDVREMAAVLAARPLAHTPSPAPAAMLPSFGGGGLGGLSVEPLVVHPAVPVPGTGTRRSGAPTGPMFALLAALSLGLFGLGAYVALDEGEPTQVETELAAAEPSASESPGIDGQMDAGSEVSASASEVEATPTEEASPEAEAAASASGLASSVGVASTSLALALTSEPASICPSIPGLSLAEGSAAASSVSTCVGSPSSSAT